ncbi:MAG: hypothetical protein OXG33_08690 [Chloroflexi bacterium]|nr:hypothetical protein [Chloroflexota bacterium]
MEHLSRIERGLLTLAAVVIAGALSATALFTAAHHFATLHTYTLAGEFFELATSQVSEFTSDAEIVISEVIREVPVETVEGGFTSSAVVREIERVREVPVEDADPRELPPSELGRGFTESTTTVTQTSTQIRGTGPEPSEPVELLSEGLWIVDVRFTDYAPPEVGNIPTVNLNSVNGRGGAGWSGSTWAHIYVAADREGAQDLGERMAVFTPGEVVLHISDLPDDVEWWADFERIGELEAPER